LHSLSLQLRSLNGIRSFSLLLTAFGYGGLSGTMSLEEVVKSINSGFGNTVGFIGIVILAGW
jgi:GntP family gluconate:H+ symporter